MKINATPTLTKKQTTTLATVATKYSEATKAVLDAIVNISKEHGAFEGLAPKAIKSKAVVKHDLNNSLFAPGLASLASALLIDSVEKQGGKDTIVHDAKYAEMQCEVKVIDRSHKLYKPMESLWRQLRDGLMAGKGWSRMHAKRAIDEAWALNGVTLKQRDLSGSKNTEAGIAKLEAADRQVATTAFEMIRDHVAGDGDMTKKQWEQVAKICRQMANEVANHTA